MKRIPSFLMLTIWLLPMPLLSQVGLKPAEFESKLASMHPQLLDVRTAREYQISHLKGALQADWSNPAQFADRLQYLDKSKPLFVYCTSGGRSGEAAKWLQNQGFVYIQNLSGGLSTWKMEGRPLEVGENKPQMSAETYLGLTLKAEYVIMDFGAEWCPPCKKMEPVLAQLVNESPKPFVLAKVDGGNDIEIMKANKIAGIPTFIIYKQGKEIFRKQGLVTLAEFKQQLQ